jgi:hypothetical protein
MPLVTSYKYALRTIGGRTSARRNPTGTIPGNQAMEQQAERIFRTKATIKERTKACTRKSRNRNGTIRLATIVYNY